MKVERTSLKRN